MVKKKGLNVFQIVGLSLIALIAVSALSIGISGNMTGNAVWGWSHCSNSNPCPAGEGDCDKDNQCLTNYCAMNVGANYGKLRSMDVCECAAGTTWDGSSCVAASVPPSSGDSSDVTYEGILGMLNSCTNVMISNIDTSGIGYDGKTCNDVCGDVGKTCISAFFQRAVVNPPQQGEIKDYADGRVIVANPAVSCDATYNYIDSSMYEGGIAQFYNCQCCASP
jgi:hypothetical protein